MNDTTGRTQPPGTALPRLLAASVAVTTVAAGATQRGLDAAGPDAVWLRFGLLVFSAALLFTVGGIFMKLSDGVTRPGPSLIMAACFVAGAILQALAMRGGDLGVVYVVVLGVEAVLAMFFGWFIFSEHLSLWKIGGAVLIVLGIATLRVQ